MKKHWKAGVSFGLTSGAITNMGLMVGLHSWTHDHKPSDIESRIYKFSYLRCIFCKTNTGDDYYLPVLNCFSFKHLVDFM
ncbi:MAG: hypothetical protein MAG551_00334 [Candidatus Scalindua arabica]|uniref:Uncharacterized protein n=1 Tax=Candidatus Scalindua arabica TaxID=1127984 RepID=A0A941VYX7_9BACT|nr:hypothetical protein [Candidatus Scalindua arabica]